MRFSCKCAQGLCVGVLTSEPPAEATVGISEQFIAPASSKSSSSGSFACLAVTQGCLLECLAPGARSYQAAAAWCNGGSGVAEHSERDLCYLQTHAVQ